MEETATKPFPISIVLEVLAIVGVVLTIILWAADRTPWTVGTMMSLMFFVGCVGIWRTGAIIRHYWPNLRNGPKIAGWVSAVIWCVFVISFSIQKWPSGIHADPRFVQAYQHFEKLLGKPQANALEIPVTTDEERFRNATALWAKNSSLDYILWDGTKRWEFLGETTPPPRAEWNDMNWLKEHFHNNSKDGGPPAGDFAYAWDRSPDYWKRLGGSQWRCGGTPHVIYQDFDNGRMIGVLRGTLYRDDGIIFILLDDYHWESVLVNSGNASIPSAKNCDCEYWDFTEGKFVSVKK